MNPRNPFPCQLALVALAAMLAALAVAARPALARPADLRAPATAHPTEAELATPAPRAAALAQEHDHLSFGHRPPRSSHAPRPRQQPHAGAGIATPVFALALSGALLIGTGVGSGAYHARLRRHAPSATT